ncbi:ABC transporter ATP-binding protein [Virgisporangium ochraceum]
MGTGTALEIVGLRKRYGHRTAVDGVDIVVPEGEIFGILGPNGSGKTTTVECAYGLRRCDSGRVRLFGTLDPQAQPDRVAGLVGVQLQDSALPDRLRVGEAVHLFASLARHRVDEAAVMAEWGLTGRRDASFGSLSGGQRQRLFVALALVARPRLVFLDEMTTGLDPADRREVWDLVGRVRAEGTTVVLVTHFMDEAERLCDRVAVMVGGRVVAEDTPGGLVDRYGGGTRVRFASNDLDGDRNDGDGIDLDGIGPLPGVVEAGRVDGTVAVRGTGAFLTALGHHLHVTGHADTELSVERVGLEEAYVALLASGNHPEEAS